MEYREKRLTKYILNQAMVGLAPQHEYEYFRQERELPRMHEQNRQGRLRVLAAQRNAIKKVLERHMDKGKSDLVLEVGCGSNGFRDDFAPEWLKKRLVGFDINEPSLRAAQERGDGEEGRLFQGNAYTVPVRDESAQTVIGLSSFDSLTFLGKAVSEVDRVLKPGGQAVFFQDCIPNLHLPFEEETTVGGIRYSFETYHERLVNTVEQQGLKVVAGKRHLSGFGFEPAKKVKERLEERVVESLGLISGFDCGVPTRTLPSLRDLGTIQRVKMRYLVARKREEGK